MKDGAGTTKGESRTTRSDARSRKKAYDAISTEQVDARRDRLNNQLRSCYILGRDLHWSEDGCWLEMLPAHRRDVEEYLCGAARLPKDLPRLLDEYATREWELLFGSPDFHDENDERLIRYAQAFADRARIRPTDAADRQI